MAGAAASFGAGEAANIIGVMGIGIAPVADEEEFQSSGSSLGELSGTAFTKGFFKAVGSAEQTVFETGAGIGKAFNSGLQDFLDGNGVDLREVFSGLEGLLEPLGVAIDGTVGKIPLIGKAVSGLYGQFRELTGITTEYLGMIGDLGEKWQSVTREMLGAGTELENIDTLMGNVQNMMSEGFIEREEDIFQLGKVQSRLGLAGRALEQFTKTYSEANETFDKTLNLETISGLLNQFHVRGKDAAQTLTVVTNLIRSVGAEPNNMLSVLKNLGPMFENFGYTLPQMTQIFTQFSLGGERVERLSYAITGLMKNILESVDSGATENLQTGLSDVLDVANQFLAMGMNDKALEWMQTMAGPRGGQTLYKALVDGILQSSEQMNAMFNGGVDPEMNRALQEGIDKTTSLNEVLTTLERQMEAAFRPSSVAFATVLEGIGGGAISWMAANQLKIATWAADLTETAIGMFATIVESFGVAIDLIKWPLHLLTEAVATAFLPVLGTLDLVAKAANSLFPTDATQNLVESLDKAINKTKELYDLNLYEIPFGESANKAGERIRGLIDPFREMVDGELAKLGMQNAFSVVDEDGRPRPSVVADGDAGTLSWGIEDREAQKQILDKLRILGIFTEDLKTFQAADKNSAVLLQKYFEYLSGGKPMAVVGPDGKPLVVDLSNEGRQVTELVPTFIPPPDGDVLGRDSLTYLPDDAEQRRQSWSDMADADGVVAPASFAAAFVPSADQTQMYADEWFPDGVRPDAWSVDSDGVMQISATLAPDDSPRSQSVSDLLDSMGVPLDLQGTDGIVIPVSYQGGAGGANFSFAGMGAGMGMPSFGALNPNNVDMTGLQPQSMAALAAIQAKFPDANLTSAKLGREGDPYEWHPDGRGLDLNVPNYNTPEGVAYGNVINQWILANKDMLGVAGTLWQVADHFDHIHVSMKEGLSPLMQSGGLPMGMPGAGSTVSASSTTGAGGGGKQAIANMILQAAMARGYSKEDATAILAYAIGESGLNPGISGGVQPGPEGGAGSYADTVIGLFQQKPAFASDGGIDPAMRSDPASNIFAYLNMLEKYRNLPIDQALPRTSGGGPLAGGSAAQPWGPLLAQAQALAGGGGSPVSMPYTLASSDSPLGADGFETLQKELLRAALQGKGGGGAPKPAEGPSLWDRLTGPEGVFTKAGEFAGNALDFIADLGLGSDEDRAAEEAAIKSRFGEEGLAEVKRQRAEEATSRSKISATIARWANVPNLFKEEAKLIEKVLGEDVANVYRQAFESVPVLGGLSMSDTSSILAVPDIDKARSDLANTDGSLPDRFGGLVELAGVLPPFKGASPLRIVEPSPGFSPPGVGVVPDSAKVGDGAPFTAPSPADLNATGVIPTPEAVGGRKAADGVTSKNVEKMARDELKIYGDTPRYRELIALWNDLKTQEYSAATAPGVIPKPENVPVPSISDRVAVEQQKLDDATAALAKMPFGAREQMTGLQRQADEASQNLRDLYAEQRAARAQSEAPSGVIAPEDAVVPGQDAGPGNFVDLQLPKPQDAAPPIRSDAFRVEIRQQLELAQKEADDALAAYNKKAAETKSLFELSQAMQNFMSKAQIRDAALAAAQAAKTGAKWGAIGAGVLGAGGVAAGGVYAFTQDFPEAPVTDPAVPGEPADEEKIKSDFEKYQEEEAAKRRTALEEVMDKPIPVVTPQEAEPFFGGGPDKTPGWPHDQPRGSVPPGTPSTPAPSKPAPSTPGSPPPPPAPPSAPPGSAAPAPPPPPQGVLTYVADAGGWVDGAGNVYSDKDGKNPTGKTWKGPGTLSSAPAAPAAPAPTPAAGAPAPAAPAPAAAAPPMPVPAPTSVPVPANTAPGGIPNLGTGPLPGPPEVDAAIQTPYGSTSSYNPYNNPPPGYISPEDSVEWKQKTDQFYLDRSRRLADAAARDKEIAEAQRVLADLEKKFADGQIKKRYEEYLAFIAEAKANNRDPSLYIDQMKGLVEEYEKQLGEIAKQKSKVAGLSTDDADQDAQDAIDAQDLAPQPPKSNKDKVDPDANAEQLGRGLVNGILEVFGLDGSVFDNFTEWGATKLLAGGINFLSSIGAAGAEAGYADGVGGPGGAGGGAGGLLPGLVGGALGGILPGASVPALDGAAAPSSAVAGQPKPATPADTTSHAGGPSAAPASWNANITVPQAFPSRETGGHIVNSLNELEIDNSRATGFTF